jgi:hypothetical protein
VGVVGAGLGGSLAGVVGRDGAPAGEGGLFEFAVAVEAGFSGVVRADVSCGVASVGAGTAVDCATWFAGCVALVIVGTTGAGTADCCATCSAGVGAVGFEGASLARVSGPDLTSVVAPADSTGALTPAVFSGGDACASAGTDCAAGCLPANCLRSTTPV